MKKYVGSSKQKNNVDPYSRDVNKEVSVAYLSFVSNNVPTILSKVNSLGDFIDRWLINASEHLEYIHHEEREKVISYIDSILDDIGVDVLDKLKSYKARFSTEEF